MTSEKETTETQPYNLPSLSNKKSFLLDVNMDDEEDQEDELDETTSKGISVDQST